jgi:WD40 repeat protein
VAFAPQGGLLAVGLGTVQPKRSHGDVMLWDVKTGSELSRTGGHTADVKALAFSPGDGRLLASAGADKVIRLWRVAGPTKPSLQHTTTEHDGEITSLAFSPEGKRLASAGKDRIVRLWTVSAEQRLKLEVSSKQANWPIEGVTFSGNGRDLFFASDRFVFQWSFSSKASPAKLLRIDLDTVSSLAISPRTGLLIAGCRDNTVRLWDLQQQKELTADLESRGHICWVWSVDVSADGKLLASGGDDRKLRLWDLSSGRPVLSRAPHLHYNEDKRHTASVTTIRFAPTGNLLAFGDRQGDVEVWELSPWQRRLTLLGRQKHDLVRCLAFNREGQRLLSAVREDKVATLWTLPPAEQKRTKSGTPQDFRARHGLISAAALAPKSGLIATVDSAGDKDNSARGNLWKAGQPDRPFLTYPCGEKKDITTLAFSPAEKFLAVGGSDGTIRVFHIDSLPDGKLMKNEHFLRLNGLKGIEFLAFSPDEKKLAATNQEGHISVWDTRTWESLLAVQLPGPVLAAAFFPDSCRLATANGNGTIYIVKLGEASRPAIGG